jgi:hypothetical protein
MSLGLWNLNWLNHNSQRSYPLTDRASKVDTTGTLKIPDSFIVALYLPVHVTLNIQVDRFYVQTLLIAPTGYAVGIGYYDEALGESTLVATTNITKVTHTINNVYAMPGVGDFADSVGHIVIGKLDEIDSLPPGLYQFDYAAAELEADVVRPMLRGLTAVRVVNGIETSPNLYGDIELVAGANMRLDYSTSLAGNPRIVFNAISGLNLNTPCSCNVNPTGECIRCINGVCSTDGTFDLVGNSCITVDNRANGANTLALSDVCATPCCGCAELDAIKTQIDRFGDGVNTLQNFVNRLSGEVTQMSLVVIGSRLGDAGCSTCG